MKIFHDTKQRIVVLTALFLLCTASAVLAHPKDKSRWDSKYETEIYLFGETPIPFLAHNVHLLPKGKALDLAMGERPLHKG